MKTVRLLQHVPSMAGFVLLSSGCAYHWGPQVHDADAASAEGRAFVLDNGVRYVETGFGIYFADIVSWGGQFAVNVVSKDGGDGESTELSYAPIKPEAALSLTLEPKKRWWVANGRWVFLSAIASFGLYHWISRLKERQLKKRST